MILLLKIEHITQLYIFYNNIKLRLKTKITTSQANDLKQFSHFSFMLFFKFSSAVFCNFVIFYKDARCRTENNLYAKIICLINKF